MSNFSSDTLYIIRSMRPEDVDEVHKIDNLSFTSPWPRHAFQHEVNNPLAHNWVVVAENGGIVGAIVVWLVVDEAHIGTLAIHPEYRRHGLAKQLLKTAMLDLVERGAVTAMLEVRESNTAAQRLYGGCGFQIVGRRRRYYQDTNEDALLMTLHDLSCESYAQRSQSSS
jgi:ribosomal-protein-alanine N-acetyltransferase